MVDFGQDPELRPGHPRVPGLRITRLTDIHRRAGDEPGRRHRLPAHLLALVTGGRAGFSVDFATFSGRPGGLLWARPGQLVGFPPPGLDATLVLFQPGFPCEIGQTSPAGNRGTATPGTYWQPGGEDEEAIVDGISQLEIDYQRIVAGEAIPLGVLRHQLAALLLRVGQLDPEGGPTQPANDSETLARFRSEIESGFARSRRVEEYAATLGCSVRTLTRASLAATGRTAKQLVDDRVALEAKRLLAESELTIAEIGARLGFSEPTNFGRFFARIVGAAPGQFRAERSREAAEVDQLPAAAAPAQPLVAALAKRGHRPGWGSHPGWD